jgi:hypothetical protein
MLVYPSAVPASLALVWPSDGAHFALMVGALAIAAVLGWVALRDRHRRLLRVEPVRLALHRDLQVPRAAA